MAADKKQETTEDENPPPKKKGKLLLFIAIGVLLVVLAGGGAAVFLMKKKAPADDEEGSDEPAAHVEKDKKSKKDHHAEAPPVFIKLEPFTVKLQTEQQESYLQATPELRVLDMPVGDRVKQYTPEIRHKVLLLMSGKKASDLSSPQGVQKLANEIRREVNLILDGQRPTKKTKGKAREEAPAEPIDEASPEDSVQAILFTSFIIQ